MVVFIGLAVSNSGDYLVLFVVVQKTSGAKISYPEVKQTLHQNGAG